MTMLVQPADVRTYLELNAVPSTSRYSDQTIGSNVLMAQSRLEQVTHRYIAPRTFTNANPWAWTTNNAQQIPLPGFRSLTAVTRSSAALLLNSGYWLIPDSMQSGVFTGMAFRAAVPSGFWPGTPGTPYGPWITNPNWFDQAADSPFFPPNVGGGVFLTSMPNDLLIEGSAGWDPTIPDGTPGAVPYDALLAIRAYAGWITMRGPSLIAQDVITPAGGVMSFSTMPAEVRDFISAWTVGQQAVSVG